MAIKPVLIFHNPDSTLDLNSRFAKIIDRGIYDGGGLTPSSVSLSISIAPFVVAGYDGLVAVSDSTESLSVPAPAVAGPARVSYLILHLEYRSLTNSIANLLVVPETTWLTSVSRNFFVTFAKISVPFGATSLMSPGVVISYEEGDWAQKAGKAGWRAPVSTFASLPTVQNRDGDVRVALDTRLAYQWNDGTQSWSAVGGAIDLQDVAARSAENRSQWHRVISGTGFINSIPYSTQSIVLGDDVLNVVDDGPGFPFLPNPTVANRGSLPGCHYMINGHFVKTHGIQNVVFSPPPGIGERYDMFMLEVWRQLVTVPASVTYNDQSGAPQSFATVRNALETLQEQGFVTNTNYDFSEMEAVSPSEFVITAYQYRVIDNVAVGALSDTSIVAPTVNNVDGNPFGITVTQTDQRLWQATAGVSSYDGVSWAIPLVIVRRTSTEGPTFISTYRNDGQRYVFDVAPRAELGLGYFSLLDTVIESSKYAADAATAQLPSGFLSGTSNALVPGAGFLRVPACTVQVHGTPLIVKNDFNVTLPSAPTGGGDARTDVVVLEVLQTAYSPQNRDALGTPTLNGRNRVGLRRSQWIGTFRVFSLPIGALQTTVDGARAAITAVTYVVPDNNDPYLWSRPADPTIGEDTANDVFALPVALIHRRNTTPFAVSVTGQNGADTSLFPGLPNQSANFPYDKEVLDVRSRVVLDDGEFSAILDESFRKLLSGDLRTNMKTHTVVGNVSGTQLLQIDQIAGAPLLGTYTLPYAPNGRSTVWSESDEVELFTWSFTDMTVIHTDPTGVFAWKPGNELTITLPQGYVLSLDPQNRVRPVGPQSIIAWSTEAGNPTPYGMKFTYNTTVLPAQEAVGDPTDPKPLTNVVVDCNLTTSAPGLPATTTVHIAMWALKRHSEVSRSSAVGTYRFNRGLLAVPDTVHRIEYSTTGIPPYSRAWVGAPVNTVEVISTVNDEVVFSQGTMYGGSIASQLASAAANLKSYFLTALSVSSGAWASNIRYVQFTDAAGANPGFERCRIEFKPGTLPIGSVVRATFVSTGDLVDTWFEIDPASKQIRGPYKINPISFSVTGGTPFQAKDVGGVGSTAVMCPLSDVGLPCIGGLPTGVASANASGVFGVLPGFGNIVYYAAGTANLAYEIWFSSADRNAARNISPGATVQPQATVNLDLRPVPAYNGGGSAIQDHGSYSGMAIINNVGPIAAHKSVIVAVYRAPLPSTGLVRVFYDYTPYQGITTNIQNNINGYVEAVSDQIVFTRGTNTPWIDFRSIATSLRWGSDGSTPPGLAVHANPVHDVGLLYSEGRYIDRESNQNIGYGSSEIYRTSLVRKDLGREFRPADRPPLALSQRLPYPARVADGSPVADTYTPEGFLGNAMLLDEPSFVRTVPPTAAWPANEASAWSQDYSTVGAVPAQTLVWKSNGGAKSVLYPVPLGIGEVCTGFVIETEWGPGLVAPGNYLRAIFLYRDKRDNTFTPVVGNDFFIEVSGGPGTKQVQELALNTPIQVLSPNFEVVLHINNSLAPPFLDLRVGSISYSVLPASYVRGGTTIKWYSMQDGTNGLGTQFRRGMRIEVPASWTSEFGLYEGNLTAAGKQDVAGLSFNRGRSSQATIVGAVIPGTNLIGYVPGGDYELARSASAFLPIPNYQGRETAPRFGLPNRVVAVGAANVDASFTTSLAAVGNALSYIVRTASDACFMGVSTGYAVVKQGVARLRLGSAVDAFHPVGRPVFRRK